MSHGVDGRAGGLHPGTGTGYPEPDDAVRRAVSGDPASVARLWTRLWRETHMPHMPERIVRLRTAADFARRVAAMGDGLRVAGPVGDVLGFAAVEGHELTQLFVAEEARGTGLAQRLLADAEARMAAAGVVEAELVCLPENAAARRFYARAGWRDRGLREAMLASSEGPMPFLSVIFTRRL